MVAVYISNKSYRVSDSSLNITRQIGQRSTCRFEVVEDSAPFSHFLDGQFVQVKDEAGQLLFTGFIAPSPEESYQHGVMYHNISCTDSHYLLDKRICTNAYKNTLAGDIVADLYNTYLKDEGIIAEYAYRKERWSDGTSTNLSTSPVDGSLQLQPSGSIVYFTPTWATFANAAVDGNGNVTLAPQQAMNFTSTNNNALGDANSSLYLQIWLGSLTLASGDKLVYDLWENPGNPAFMMGIDGQCSDGSTIRDFSASAIVDQNGMKAHPNTDLKTLTSGQWYSRIIDLSLLAGKTLSFMTVVNEADIQGNYQAYIKKVFIKDSSGNTKLTVFDGTTQQLTLLSNRDYSAYNVTTTTVYVGSGTVISNPVDISAAGLFQSGSLTYLANPDDQLSAIVSASMDNGVIWQPVASGGALSLLPGLDLTGRKLYIKIDLVNLSSPTTTPVVNSVTGVVNPSYKPASPKTDTIKSYGRDFTGTGTLTNVLTDASNGLYLQNFSRNWDDRIITNQALSGSGSPAQGVTGKNYWLQCNATSEAKARLDFVGQIADFTAQIDILMDNSSVLYSFMYRSGSSSWGASSSDYAYAVEINLTSIKLNKGANGQSGSNTTLSTYTINLTSGNWHTLTVTAQGSTHKVYLDGVLAITQTDSTYTSAGYVGLRNRNTSSATYKMLFDNFSIVSANPGTWVSSALSIPGPVAASQVYFDAATPIHGSLVIDASLDGGATWTVLSNGDSLPLTQGATNKSLTVRATLSAGTGAFTPIVRGLTVYVSSTFSATGTRTSPALDLSPAIRAASSNVSWDASQPTGTTINIEISTDRGANWQTLSSSGSPIPNIYHQPAPHVDLFDHSTAANYIQHGSWQWDTTNKLLKSTGTGFLLYNASTYSANDGYVEADIVQPGGGLIVNAKADTDTTNGYDYYYVNFDSSGIQLFKWVPSGLWSLGESPAITFDEAHRVRLQTIAGVLTVLVDGQEVISWDDNPYGAIGAGMLGLISTGGLRVSSLRVQPLGDVLAGKSAMLRTTLTSSDPSVTPSLAYLSTGMRSNKIDAGDLIPEVVFDYIKTSDAIQQVADLSNIWFNIDETQALWFKQYNGLPAPYIATEAIMMDNVKVTNGNPRYRNRQYTRSQNTTDVQTFTARGGQQTYTMAFPLANAPTITINTIPATTGIKGVDSGKSFYWSKGDAVISPDSSLATTLNDVIVFTYQGLFEYIYLAEDTAQATARKQIEGGNTTGYVEELETVDVSTADAAAYMAKSLLQQFSQESYAISFSIPPTALKSGGLLREGQLLHVKLPEHNLDTDFLIENISISVDETTYWYDVTASYGTASDKWEQFFDRLTKGPQVSTASVGTDQVTTIAQGFNEATSWQENITYTVFACPLPSVTLYPSASIYPC